MIGRELVVIYRRQLDLANEVAPAFKAALPGGGELTRKLTIAARLINANIGLRVIDVGLDGFDNHADYGTLKFSPNEQTYEGLGLDRPLAARYATWLANLARGDWGTSDRYGIGVRELVESLLTTL